MLSVEENNTEKSNSFEKEDAKVNKSSEGLILKELLGNLKYAFLQPEKGKPDIIAAGLTELEKHKLLEIFRKYKEVIVWSIEDLKGISPSIWMHKILLEEIAKISIEQQMKDESNNERSSQKRSSEMAKCRLHICNHRLSLGEPSSCGSKERSIHYDHK